VAAQRSLVPERREPEFTQESEVVSRRSVFDPEPAPAPEQWLPHDSPLLGKHTGPTMGYVISALVGGGVMCLAFALGYLFRAPAQVAVAPPTSTPTAVVATEAPAATSTAAPTPTKVAVATPPPTPRPTPKPLTPEQKAAREAARHWSRGRSLHRSGRLEEAVVELKKAIQLDPKQARYHAYLALALYDSDDLAGAQSSAQRAIRLNRREPWGYLALANVQQASGKTDQALQSYEAFLRLEPKGTMAREVRQIVDMLRATQ
jgi:tetratricopeptide (TPR) repeat protein